MVRIILRGAQSTVYVCVCVVLCVSGRARTRENPLIRRRSDILDANGALPVRTPTISTFAYAAPHRTTQHSTHTHTGQTQFTLI